MTFAGSQAARLANTITSVIYIDGYADHLLAVCNIWHAWQVKAEKPAWYLGVIAGALLRTLDVVASGSAEYLGYLEKGQLPPARLSLTSFQHSFVLEGEHTSHLYISLHIPDCCLMIVIEHMYVSRILHISCGLYIVTEPLGVHKYLRS